MSGGVFQLKLKCIHGFFIFEETNVGQISDFMSLYQIPLVPYDDSFTFEALEDAPDYSIKGLDLLGLPAVKTFEGKPWEVFEANGFVYDFTRGLMTPITSITTIVNIELAGNRYISPGLILPGSLTDAGKRVTDYSAWYLPSRGRWLYSEVTIV